MSKLEELMKAATPLPWSIDFNGKDPQEEPARIKGPDKMWNVAFIPSYENTKARMDADATLLCHAVNMLPKLVEALEKCRFVLEECSIGREKLSELFPKKLELVRAVLSEANNPEGVK